MILWHTGDGWLRPGLKAGEGFTFLRFVGGLAAPSFLLLAGLAAGLSARTDPELRDKQFLSAIGRGGGVLVIGYALRLQNWLIDASALLQLSTMRAWLPIGLGYIAIYWACHTLTRHTKRAAYAAAAACVLVLLGFMQLQDVAPGRGQRLLSVDVLHAIGLSLVLLGVLQRTLNVFRRPWVLIALGVGVGLATSFVWAGLPGSIPVPLAALLGRFEPGAGGPVVSLFPLFPWFAYACVGATVGRGCRAAAERGSLDTTVLSYCVVGAALACLTSESQPLLRTVLADAPSLIPLVRIAYRCGLVLAILGAAFAFGESRPLRSLGTTSLRVYWAHMLFAYGVVAKPMRLQLGYASWIVLAAALVLAMWGLSQVRLKSDHA